MSTRRTDSVSFRNISYFLLIFTITYWCSHCSVEFDAEAENLRKDSKIIVPDRNEEAAISSVQNIPDVSIRHEPELRGGFAALA
jgi:hypothetical protein